METTLRILLQRDPSRDREDLRTCLQGYNVLWPDGRAMSVGFDAFCRQGQRLLGLGRWLPQCGRQLIDLICFHVVSREECMTRLAGHRVRRFCFYRKGRTCQLHFLDGTPTAILLDLDSDEPYLLNWLGLLALEDGESSWFDLAARIVEPAEHILA
jgi:hypothetical protein